MAIQTRSTSLNETHAGSTSAGFRQIDNHRNTRKYDGDERHDPPEESYVHRLTEADRVQSQVPPGTRDGRFRVLYILRNEALGEIRNSTVHGFLALAFTPRDQGYVVHLAIYVKAVSRFTVLYMALIDPFRRFVVYPAIGRTIQQAWLRTYR